MYFSSYLSNDIEMTDFNQFSKAKVLIGKKRNILYSLLDLDAYFI